MSAFIENRPGEANARQAGALEAAPRMRLPARCSAPR